MKFIPNGKNGFALIASLLTLWVLTAVGMLVFTVSTKDIRISNRSLGEKKAFSAAQSGIHWLTQNFDPVNLSAVAVGWTAVDPANDAGTQYMITAPGSPTSGPAAIVIQGYSMGGGETWGQMRYVATVSGRNTNIGYDSRVETGVGVGYGPVDITTIYR